MPLLHKILFNLNLFQLYILQKTILMRTLDPTFDKYIKNCLKSVLADSAAVKYSWYGKGQTHKIPIKSYRVIALIEG